jgi:hypothetical protein
MTIGIKCENWEVGFIKSERKLRSSTGPCPLPAIMQQSFLAVGLASDEVSHHPYAYIHDAIFSMELCNATQNTIACTLVAG